MSLYGRHSGGRRHEDEDEDEEDEEEEDEDEEDEDDAEVDGSEHGEADGDGEEHVRGKEDEGMKARSSTTAWTTSGAVRSLGPETTTAKDQGDDGDGHDGAADGPGTHQKRQRQW